MNDYRGKMCGCGCNNNTMPMDNMNDNCEDNMMVTEENSMCTNMCQRPKMNCDCGFNMNEESVFPDNPMLAQSYVPIQRMKKVFTPEVGLKMGTIFPELVSPYMPGQSMMQIEYLKNSNEIGEGCNR